MPLRSLCILSLLAMTSGVALADMGLAQVRHALFLDSRAPVEADLRRLAERGDRASMHLLGNLIASDPRKTDEAIDLYQRAFAQGRGEIRALTSLSRLLDRLPRRQAEHQAYVRTALMAIPLERDPYTLEAALETFLVYPQLFKNEQVERLLTLYQRSCIELCGSELYRAVDAARRGDREEAVRWYELAIRNDPRAIERYYTFLGDRRDSLFHAFAQRLEAEREQLPEQILHPLGELLETIAQAENEQATLPLQQLRIERDLNDEEIRQEQALAERYRVSRQYAQTWIEAAVARDYAPAMISRINYMLSWATEYSDAQVLELIARLEPLEPLRAKAAQAQVKLVNNWSSLDPHGAHQLIQELIASGYDDGEILLAGLYSKGSLDQPDQARALQILQRLADQGSLTAHYRIAQLYSEGRGICREPAKAYAHAYFAKQAGERRAESLLRRLERLSTPAQREEGLRISQQLTARTLP